MSRVFLETITITVQDGVTRIYIKQNLMILCLALEYLPGCLRTPSFLRTNRSRRLGVGVNPYFNLSL